MKVKVYVNRTENEIAVWKTKGPSVNMPRIPLPFYAFETHWCFILEAKNNRGQMHWKLSLCMVGNKTVEEITKIKISVFAKDKRGGMTRITEPCSTRNEPCCARNVLAWSGSLRIVLDNKLDFMVDGEFTFFCFFDKEISCMWDINMTKKPDRCAIETDCGEEFSRDILKLLGDRESSDLQLKCGKQTFFVHRCILSARSEMFACMLKQPGDTLNIDIDDCDTFARFLEYIYSGQVYLTNLQKAKNLYLAAHDYAVNSLKQKCRAFMVKNLHQGNVCHFLLLAHSYSDTQLKNAAIAFAVEERGFLGSERFRRFARNFPDLAVDVYIEYHRKKYSEETAEESDVHSVDTVAITDDSGEDHGEGNTKERTEDSDEMDEDPGEEITEEGREVSEEMHEDSEKGREFSDKIMWMIDMEEDLNERPVIIWAESEKILKELQKEF